MATTHIGDYARHKLDEITEDQTETVVQMIVALRGAPTEETIARALIDALNESGAALELIVNVVHGAAYLGVADVLVAAGGDARGIHDEYGTVSFTHLIAVRRGVSFPAVRRAHRILHSAVWRMLALLPFPGVVPLAPLPTECSCERCKRLDRRDRRADWRDELAARRSAGK